jgi:hypothetical protein
MKMPGCEFSKANFLASPRDLPSGARMFLTVEAELANGSKAWRFNERPLECPLTSWESPNGLEPVERISEFLFGLIMVLTLTCTFNVREANHSSVRTLLKDALGCNVAWGSSPRFSISGTL